jgi:hypothetical protein
MELVDDIRRQPDEPFAALVDLVLVTDAAERQGGGYRLERLDADRDADHAVSVSLQWQR